MIHQFRFIQPLLPKNKDGLTPLHYYDAAIQLVRHASREPTEAEFEVGMRAAHDIRMILIGCKEEMKEGSLSDMSGTLFAESKVQ